MTQGLERLFWLLGGMLILPFLIQQGMTLSNNASAKDQARQLGSLSEVPQSRMVRQH